MQSFDLLGKETLATCGENGGCTRKKVGALIQSPHLAGDHANQEQRDNVVVFSRERDAARLLGLFHAQRWVAVSA